jgi:hydroxyacylglutathione hydrolase
MTTRLLASTASKRKLSTTVLALVSSAVGPSAAFSTMSSSSFAIAQFPCLGDNYGYLLHDPTTGDTCAIDTPCAKTYQNELAKRNWNLTHIFNTHHHSDHQGGNLELKETGGVTIMGPKNEKRPISGIDYAVAGGDTVKFGGFEAQVLDAGGHTHGHVAYYFPKQGVVFTGDCLFTLGCGKMFEGKRIPGFLPPRSKTRTHTFFS